MKIDFNYKFKTFIGDPIREQASSLTIEQLLDIENWQEFDNFRNELSKGKQSTLRSVATNVLLMTEIGGNGRARELSGDKKVERYDLAMKIHKSPDGLVDLKSEQVTLLKELIAKAYGPLMVGQAYEILDPHEAEERKK